MAPYKHNISSMAPLFLSIWLYAISVSASFKFFDGPTGFGRTLHTPSSSCAAALNTTINCEEFLVLKAHKNDYNWGNETLQDQLCNPNCGTSLASYSTGVASQCGTANLTWEGLPNTYYGDRLKAYYDLICLKDGDGDYCVQLLNDAITDLMSTDANLGKKLVDLPNSFLCSECHIKYFRQIQSSMYSNYDERLAASWRAIQTKCSVTYPSDVQEWTLDPPIPPDQRLPPGSTANQTCVSGNFHTVISSDTCVSISSQYDVNTYALQILNGLFLDCSNLKVGDSLCLPEPCAAPYQVQEDDYCADIEVSHGLSLGDLVNYNPGLNVDCTNLWEDFTICLNPNGGDFTPTTIGGTVPTRVGEYATETIAPPGPTPDGSTPYCGKWYTVKEGDFCELISIAEGVTLDLFYRMNPFLNNQTCENLWVDTSYCVWPIEGWDIVDNVEPLPEVTYTETTITAPAPTISGTTTQCYKWHEREENQTCDELQATWGVTLEELRLWNPSINSGCSNLQTGKAYCVRGPLDDPIPSITGTSGPTGTRSTTTARTSSHTSTTTSRTTTTTPAATSSGFPAPPAPTGPGTTNQCKLWHETEAGDSCWSIYTEYDITFANLRTWNPALDSDCTNLELGMAYCVDGPGGRCTQKYTVGPGDFCWKIWDDHSITEVQFRAWNPSINENCDVWEGLVVCVAHS
ncbi:hypothetical protein TWF191_006958 [Orbilia oligospora]|uniref:LysM domain-containing protein n=1 Tax=Orbilia oligospora TaxID=2813651 RepID=A0A7C8UU18_ORBOL|nr:hypothetical protein TWF191_006958 [Orbilia oligospora]